MRPRHFARTAMLLMLALGAAACSSGTSTPATDNSPKTLTIWLMNGSAPQTIVDAVNADFKASHSNVTVNVEIQQWSDVTTKLDTAYAGSKPPDVAELGNTLVAKYASVGALADITSNKGSFENSNSWLQSLTESCTLDGKLYCVPYYAGTRAVIYRKDMFTSAGVQPPKTMDEWLASGQKLVDANKSDSSFSALYYPGQYWYAAMSFVWDFGGDIATKSGGQWKGALSSAPSQQGLTTLNNMVQKLSKADKTGDELKQDAAFAQGHIASIIGNGWEVGVITDPKGGDPALKDKLAAFPIPGHTSGQTAPVFLGGSDLAIAKKSANQDLARQWVNLLAGNKYQTQMATVGKVIPNSTTLLDLNKDDPILSVYGLASKNSRFVPNSPNWANVESAKILQDMLVSIFTGKASTADAAKVADDKIATILNTKS